jgi:hypothetical protein
MLVEHAADAEAQWRRFMRPTQSILLVGCWATIFCVMPSDAQQRDAQQIYESMLGNLDPSLIHEAERLGIYDRDSLPVLRAINPFFLRGDFNGDGELDIAFWVQNHETQERGVAILHSTLDRLHVFGAGQSLPEPQGSESTAINVDAWHLVSRGTVESHPYSDIPAIGLTEGQPFTFERETLEFVYLEKAAFVFYWANGQYWQFATAD